MTSVLIAQAVFLSQLGHMWTERQTDRQKPKVIDATDHHMHATTIALVGDNNYNKMIIIYLLTVPTLS